MPVDLSTQTRDLFTRIDERQEPIGLTEITTLAQTRAETSPPDAVVGLGEVASSDLVVNRSWWRKLGVAVAAAALVLLVVGGVAWLSRSVETEDPADQSTTTTVPTTTTIVDAARAELTLEQQDSQLEFAAAFGAVGACEGSGPWQCEGHFDVALFDGPRTVFVTVTETDDEYSDIPGHEQHTLLLSVATRGLLEAELGLLYEWALVNHPDTTEQLCGVGFQGDDDYAAWPPGYRANGDCGMHLRALIAEYKPEETAKRFGAVVLEPATGVGSWGPVEDALSLGDSGLNINPNNIHRDFFAVASTPYGLVASSTDGLWISVDEGHIWEPFVRDQVVFQPESSFARIAHSPTGTLVIDTNGDSPNPQNNAWFSTDGVTWTPTELLPTEPSRILWLVPIADGFLGMTQSPVQGVKPAVFHTVDGTSWEPIPPDAPDIRFWSIVETPFGYYGTATTGDTQSVWYSPDGLDWQREVLAIDGPGLIEMAGSSLGVVVVSQEARERQFDPAPEWTMWYSSDGVEFVEVEDPGFTERLTFYSVTALKDGFFVVAELAGAQPEFDPSIWTGWYSDDGTNWHLVPAHSDMRTMAWDGFGIRGVVATDNGAVAYGLSWDDTNFLVYQR
jgi:hypothetical protein